jgi:predicted dehydrogenase
MDCLVRKVLIVGAGQLGSRYLQGLAGIKRHLSITVVDPSDQSLGIAKERLAEVGPSPHSFQFLNSISESKDPVDLCIVTTPAHCRAAVVSDVASNCRVKAWVLEKVLAQSSSQITEIERVIGSSGSGAWVNTPRRLMTWHKQIRNNLHDLPGPYQVTIAGSGWGLACNSIHFIDFIAWLTGSTLISIDTNGLESNWIPSKRSGFQEVLGEMLMDFSDGSQLTLACSQDTAPTIITITTSKGVLRIDEAEGIANLPNGRSLDGKVEFQSVLTGPMVEQILQEGSCDLPTLYESAALHRPLLDSLLLHWNHTQHRSDLVVPIT